MRVRLKPDTTVAHPTQAGHYGFLSGYRLPERFASSAAAFA